MKSLLRYVGGKSRAVKHILPYFPYNIDEVCSPFIGGGSIELALAALGVRVHGYDAFMPLVCFWEALKNNKNRLEWFVQQHHPLIKEEFYLLQDELREEIKNGAPSLKMATAFYVLNRASFSGSTLSGGMSPKHPRFNQASIDRIRALQMPELLSVEQADFTQSIANHPKTFLYCDPPYLLKKKSNLYGDKGSMHKGFDHATLCDILKKHEKGWLLSYNDCPEIREMYKDYRIKTPQWQYGMSKDKKSKEVLIINYKGNNQ